MLQIQSGIQDDEKWGVLIMLPIIAIVGRSNVGKSTLFNYLTRSRAALVANVPGVTRDLQYGETTIDSQKVSLVDTGGLVNAENTGITTLIERKVDQAIDESNCVLFLVDSKTGLVLADEIIAEQLRKRNKKVILVVNKSEHNEIISVSGEFYQLGYGEPQVISAKSGRGVNQLMMQALNYLPQKAEVVKKESHIKIAVIGRPNVGKSTLINQLLGEERVIVYDQPGTTRDSIYISSRYNKENYTLIDTAGIQRRAKILDFIEKFSIIKSMQVMHEADVVIFVLNAKEGVSEQDLRLLNLITEESGVPLVIVINKWDNLSVDERKQVKYDIERRMSFVDFAYRYFISALQGTGVNKLYWAVRESYYSTQQECTTAQLTKMLEKAVSEHQPPLIKGRRIRLRYAHLGSRHPLTIVIHGKQTQLLPQSYARYLSNYFRKTFNFIGVPVHIKLKTDKNPYKD